jgi:hypothetical protein
MPLEVPTTRDAAALADWAELLVLRTDGNSVSATRLGRLLRGEGTDQAEEEITLDQGAEIDVDEGIDVELALVDEGRDEREVRVEQLLDEISLRLELGPTVYPFARESDVVVRRAAPGEDAYLLLLVLSWKDAPCRGEKRLHEVEAAYDALAMEALRRYLGRDARGVRFAKNAHDPNDNLTRPKKFREAIKWLREQLLLGIGLKVPPDEERVEHWEDEGRQDAEGRRLLNSYKDGGVDVVVWWRFGDERPGAPVLLAQCTVQLAWEEKVSDIKLSLWEKWIDFSTVPPQRALVIPFAISRGSDTWGDHTVTAGVIVDRLRLIELLDELEAVELESLVDEETRQWVDTELAAAA